MLPHGNAAELSLISAFIITHAQTVNMRFNKRFLTATPQNSYHLSAFIITQIRLPNIKSEKFYRIFTRLTAERTTQFVNFRIYIAAGIHHFINASYIALIAFSKSLFSTPTIMFISLEP